MGVRGLQTLASRRDGGDVTGVAASSTLLVDGLGLLWFLLRGDVGLEYGGDLEFVDEQTVTFVAGLLDRGHRVIVYVDGRGRRMKARTAATRRAQRAASWAALKAYARRDDDDGAGGPAVNFVGDLPTPRLARRVFEATLRRPDRGRSAPWGFTGT